MVIYRNKLREPDIGNKINITKDMSIRILFLLSDSLEDIILYTVIIMTMYC